MAGFESSARAPLPYLQQVAADFLLDQLVGRSVAIMLYQRGDSLKIDLLRLGRESSQLHVFNHSGTQC